MSANENRNLTIRINGKQVTNSVSQIRKEFFILRREVNELNRDSEEYQQGIKELNRVSGILKKHQQDIRGARVEISKTAAQWGRIKESALGYLGGGLILKGLRGIAGGFRNLLGTSTKFEASQSALAAILEIQVSQMKDLTADAKRLGAATKFTATEVNGLQQEYARLGFTQKEIIDVTEDTLNLAAAAGSELAPTAATVGGTLKAFGLAATETQRVTDVMAKSFSSSALNIERWQETMKTAAPIARAAGIEVETAAAFAGKLADAGIHGSLAGTALKKIFNELAKDGKPLQESLKDVSAQLSAASSESERLAIAEELVGERGQAALLALANQTDDLGKLESALRNAGGAAERMADTQLDNLSGRVTKLGSAWEGFLLSMEDGDGAINQVAESVVDLGASILDWITVQDKASDSLIAENVAIQNLVGSITDANTEEQERAELISQLQKQYPDFLGELEAENLSNEQIRDRLQEVNSAYQERIFLQIQAEERDEVATELAEKANRQAKAAVEIQSSALRILTEKAAKGDLQAKADLTRLNSLDNQRDKLREIAKLVDNDALLSDNAILGVDLDQSFVAGKIVEYSALGKAVRGLKQETIELNEQQALAREFSNISEEGALESGKSEEEEARLKSIADQKKADEAARNSAAIARKSEVSDAEKIKQIRSEIKDLEILRENARQNKDDGEVHRLEQEILELKAQLNGGRRSANEIGTIKPTAIQVPVELSGEEKVLAGVEEISRRAQQVVNQGAPKKPLLKKLFEGDNSEETIAAIVDYASELAGSFLDIQRTSITSERDARLASIKEQHNAKSISEQEYQSQRKAIEAESNKKLQANAINQAIINGIVAVTSTLAKQGFGPQFLASLPLIAATTTAQIKKIKAQKFETGGSFLVGPSHSNGGMPVLDPVTGAIRAELEGGEFIIRKNSVNKQTLPLLHAINSGSMPDVNFEMIRNKFGTPLFAEGGQFAPGESQAINDNSMVVEAINNLNYQVSAWQQNLRVENSLTDLDQATSRRDSLKKVASV